ncbi:hypothetical protein V3C99_008543 [Haemonchus contortus]|nr:unnamed protein product [Haemonchus contortus]
MVKRGIKRWHAHSRGGAPNGVAQGAVVALDHFLPGTGDDLPLATEVPRTALTRGWDEEGSRGFRLIWMLSEILFAMDIINVSVFKPIYHASFHRER